MLEKEASLGLAAGGEGRSVGMHQRFLWIFMAIDQTKVKNKSKNKSGTNVTRYDRLKDLLQKYLILL